MNIYVDVIHGDNQNGDGTAGNPYRTLSFVAAVAGDGDEIRVNNPDTRTVFQDTPVVFEGRTNLTLRFLTTSSEPYSRAVWEPINVGTSDSIVSFSECTDCRLVGANFTSCKDKSGVILHAVKAESCNKFSIGGCHIDSSWAVANAPEGSIGSMFLLDGCVKSSVSSVIASSLHNSFNTNYDIIALKGNADYEVFSCEFKDIQANNYRLNAIHIYPDVKKVTIDGFLAHVLTDDIDGNAVGIYVEGEDDYVPSFVFNSCQLSKSHIGIEVRGIKATSEEHKITHSTFYKCRTGIRVVDSNIDIYSCSISAGGTTYTYEYPPGTFVTNRTGGIRTTGSANVNVVNTLVTDCHYAFYAAGTSIISLDHIIWYSCEELSGTLSGGQVNVVEYVRASNPEYEGLHDYPWGNFMISGTSPCIDAGRTYGEEYLGAAPDVGAYERSRTIQATDLPSLLHRASRTSRFIPMTNIDIEGMIRRGLETCDPSMNIGREGSAVLDIAVKPLAGLLKPFVTELEEMKKNLSFANLAELSNDAADALAANLFVNRRAGSYASGVVRLYFNDPQEVMVPADIEFVTNANLKFYTTIGTYITAEEMSLNYENGLYYMDIPAVAGAEGILYNIRSGEITKSTMSLPSGVVSVTNPTQFTGGSTSESNAELYERIKMAITTRDLVTKRSIAYVLTEQFSSIKDIVSVGFGDPEMLRDTVMGYHIGGKVDTYIKSGNITKGSMVVEDAAENTPINGITWGDIPVLRIISIELIDKLTQDTTGIYLPKNKWRLQSESANTRFSTYEALNLHIDPAYVGQTLQVNYEYVPEMADIQRFVLDDANRVICTDILIKHYEPVYVSLSFGYYADAEIPGLVAMVRNFIFNITGDGVLKESELIEYLHSLGATHVVNPFQMSYTWHKVDGTSVSRSSDDYLEISGIACYLPDSVSCAYLGAGVSQEK